MITFDPNTLYTREDLLRMFGENSKDADYFLGQLDLSKRIHGLYGGRDLLEAFYRLPTIHDQREAERKAALASTPRGRGRPRKADIEMAKMGL